MLAKHELVAVGAFLASLQGSNLPVRRPSYTRPTYWSRPLFRTLARPVPAGTDWFDFLAVSGLKQYIATVSHFVATSVGNFALTGLEYRMRLDGNPLPLSAVQFAPGVELNKEGPNTYPVIPRRLFQPVLETQTLSLQVRNTGGLQRVAVAAFYGWYFEAIDSTVFGHNGDAVTDAIYPPFAGPSYG